MEANYSYVTRQDILNFPFPYKLWLAVNLEYCDFLRWNRDGTVILLDLVTLEDYLNSTRSIFKIKNSSTFLKHMEEFKFERLNSTPEAEEDLLLQYKNENFQRHRLDLLAKIRRHTYQLLGELTTHATEGSIDKNFVESGNKEHVQFSSIPKRVSERMLGDLCFMFHGGLSRIKKSRLRFQTILHFNNEKRILKEKLNVSESIQTHKSKLDSVAEDQVIELSAELFENPHDSVLSLSQEFLPMYAGYYGNCSIDQIMHFFGEYLPKYEDGSLEVKKFAEGESTNNSLSINAETNVPQYYSPGTSGKPNIIISTPVAQNAVYNLNFSSNLEPIFNTNESSENINFNYSNNNFTVTHLNSNILSNDDDILNSNSLNNEEDISMEEFLKFKNPNKESVLADCQQVTSVDNSFSDCNNYPEEQENMKLFPQMPSSFQMKLNEDVKENEANFRNFFIQYRASLNLLYDRQ